MVNLAGGKRIVVDAKMPFAAYLEAMETTDPAVREQRLNAHARHLRTPIESLAAKRKNTRILEAAPPTRDAWHLRPITGGLLVQQPDRIDADGDVTVTGTAYFRLRQSTYTTAIERGSFNPKSGTLKLESEFTGPQDAMVKYVIEGHVENDTLQVSYAIGGDKGTMTMQCQ